jgi:hypothetical protein
MRGKNNGTESGGSLSWKAIGKAVAPPNTAKERAMNDSDDFAAMNDPELLAEYDHLRETVDAISDRVQRLAHEISRRATAARLTHDTQTRWNGQ